MTLKSYRRYPTTYVPAKRLEGFTFVYVAECEGHSKIGLSDWPNSRAEAMQTGCPFKVSIHHSRQFATRKEGQRAERALHRQFDDRRGLGEWFSVPAAEVALALEAFQVEPLPA